MCERLFVFWVFFCLSLGAWQSYQTGIHHKSTPSPELGQLLAAQRHGEAGEQSARHQVEQGGLAHLHHGQGHEGDEQTHAVRWGGRGEGGRHERRDRRRAVSIQKTGNVPPPPSHVRTDCAGHEVDPRGLD